MDNMPAGSNPNSTGYAGQARMETQAEGGNISGNDPMAPTQYMVPAFQGRSGTPDNQDTMRPKGSV